MIEGSLFMLRRITDNPQFEGFGFVRDESVRGATFLDKVTNQIRPSPLVWDFGSDNIKTKGRAWTVPPLAPYWKPQAVKGRVRSFNDYPCVNLTIPAFSAHAVDALRDFLEPNGELLPLVSTVGDYYAYNITTVGDILDHGKSAIEWADSNHITAMNILRYECIFEKMAALSIFLLVEEPTTTYATQRFVDRVQQHELQGFHFIKVWPLPEGVSWQELDKKERKKKVQVKTKRGATPVKANTVVLMLPIVKAKPSKAEKDGLAKVMDEIDALLYDPKAKPNAPLLGNLEGNDVVEGEVRLFLSCPDADALVEKLRPWLTSISWAARVKVLKRYGDFADVGCREEYVNL